MPRPKATDQQAIIDAAARIFRAKGYQNTTVDDIAREAGITKPTIYHYVKGKSWLLETIFETILQRLSTDQDRIIAEEEDPSEQLRETIRYYLKATADLRPYFHIFFAEEAELPRRTQKRVRELSRGMTDKVALIMREGAKRGQFRSDVDAEVGAFLLSSLLASVYRWYDPRGPLTADDIASQVIAMLEGYFLDGRAQLTPPRDNSDRKAG